MTLIATPISQTYLSTRFGLGVEERGYLGMIPAAASALGLVAVAPFATKLLGERPRSIVVIQAAQFLLTAGLYGVLIQFDSVPYAVVILTLIGFLTGLAFPITFQLQNLTIPPRMRGFGLQVTYLFSAPAGILISVLFKSVDSFGGVVIIVAALSVLAGGALLTTLPHIERDIANARISAMADEELRKHREDGGNALLLCRKVEVGYGGVQVLFDIDLQVTAGEVVALLGTNGAGKSTLLRAISGQTEPFGGAIYLDGVDITHRSPHESAEAGVVVVPGGRGVCASLTVKENLRLAAWLRRKDSDYVEGRMEAALELFPRLRERLDADAGNLSGGEQQMLAIAQSYLMEPRLLMIDELSLGLAPQVVESLLDSLRKINETGTTILLVEQSINVALTIADRAIFMDKGEIRFDGSTEELLSRPDLVRSVFMGGAATSGRGRRRTVQARSRCSRSSASACRSAPYARSTTSPWSSRRGRSSASSDPTARARPRSSTPSRGSCPLTTAPFRSRAPTSPRSASTAAPLPASAARSRMPGCSRR
jgi:branched-chain amino acid transport system ATP-binding protein